MSNRVKSIALSEIQRIASLTYSAITSGAYLYPFRGIIYLLTHHHRTLWQPLQSRLIPTLALGAGVTTTMFFLTYIPQMTLLAFTGSGPLVAPISAALLVLNESSMITNFLAQRNWFLGFDRKMVKRTVNDDNKKKKKKSGKEEEEVMVSSNVEMDLFDATLILRGYGDLVSGGREIGSGAGVGAGSVLSKLGGFIVGSSKRKDTSSSSSPLLTSPLDNLIRSLLYLPLNFIPIIGTIAFLAIKGKKKGHDALNRYFELKGYSLREKEEWLEKYEGDYISFGIAASVLELVPFASFVFACTNNVGAALWASSIENKSGKEESKKCT